MKVIDSFKLLIHPNYIEGETTVKRLTALIWGDVDFKPYKKNNGVWVIDPGNNYWCKFEKNQRGFPVMTITVRDGYGDLKPFIPAIKVIFGVRRFMLK